MINFYQLTRYSVFALCALGQAYSTNYQLLESEADTINERIWSNTSNSTEFLQKTLNFMDDQDDVETYLDQEKFAALRQQKMNLIRNLQFQDFSIACGELYALYEDIDPFAQAAVYMLYDRVTKKVEQHEIMRKQIFGPIKPEKSISNVSHAQLPIKRKVFETQKGEEILSPKPKVK